VTASICENLKSVIETGKTARSENWPLDRAPKG